jgi:phosphatidylserine/phosphatidylglycerophosphate/cardiolipin synthase-like enzyme
MTTIWQPQRAVVAPQRVLPPARPAAPPSRFTLPADPSQMRPAARTNIRAVPLFPGDRALDAAANLIATVASRPDGWLYMANWYIHRDMTLASGRSLANILAGCAARGGRIRGLFWHGSLQQIDPIIRGVTSPLGAAASAVITPIIRQTLANRITNIQKNEETARYINALPGGRCIARLDDATLTFGSHHQKILVVGNNERIDAIVGGVDWHNDRIRRVAGDAGSPMFDISVQLDAQAANDVAELFERRWRANPVRARIPLPPRRAPVGTRPGGGATVQIGPNFGCKAPFTSVPHAIRSGNALISNVLGNCQNFFYAEDQYGVGNDGLERAIRRAFANGANYGVIVLANGAAVSDIPEISYRRWKFWAKFYQFIGRKLFVFERVGDDGSPLGPHAYVHSKLVIVDDQAATIASVNQNRRSWYHDSELAALITDAPDLIRGMRVGVWGHHLTNLRPSDNIRDPAAALQIWRSVFFNQRQMTRIKPFPMTKVPPRLSAHVSSRIRTGTNWAAPLLGVGGWALGRLAGSGIGSTIDTVMDTAFDKIYDPSGPASC